MGDEPLEISFTLKTSDDLRIEELNLCVLKLRRLVDIIFEEIYVPSDEREEIITATINTLIKNLENLK